MKESEAINPFCASTLQATSHKVWISSCSDVAFYNSALLKAARLQASCLTRLLLVFQFKVVEKWFIFRCCNQLKGVIWHQICLSAVLLGIRWEDRWYLYGTCIAGASRWLANSWPDSVQHLYNSLINRYILFVSFIQKSVQATCGFTEGYVPNYFSAGSSDFLSLLVAWQLLARST